MTRFEAIKLIDLNEAVTVSGLKLARIVVNALKTTDSVSLSFSGLRGVPSSFYNTFISHLFESYGADAFEVRVKLEFDSSVQRDTFDRSLHAALKK